MKITKNFSESEFLKEGDTFTDVQKIPLFMLCTLILQPTRDAFGTLRITSGKRSAEHNAKIGGSKTSEHMYNFGQAACDFQSYQHPEDHLKRLDIFRYIAKKDSCFGQLIWYTGTKHLHVSVVSPSHNGELLLKDTDGSYIRLANADEVKQYDSRLV